MAALGLYSVMLPFSIYYFKAARICICCVLRSVPVPGDQVRIGARGISRVTAGGRIGILSGDVAGDQF